MLLDPPGWPGAPQELPHWPYVQAVDAALTARGIPPGTVRVNHHGLDRGLTTYMTLGWDASRAGGRGGIRLDWEERKGWYYALTGLNPHDVILYSVLPALHTPIAAPEEVADIAEHLVRHRRLPDKEFWTEWDGAREIRAAACDFRRGRLGLAPARPWEDAAGSERENGPGVQLTIDTQADTYEQAIAAVRAAYGRGTQA